MTNKMDILLVLSTISAVLGQNTHEYCEDKYNCVVNDTITRHTVCEYSCDVSENCTEFSSWKFTSMERQFVMGMHNSLRNRFAMGRLTNVSGLTASDMLALNYDMELEDIAKCWAKKCVETKDFCRGSTNFSFVGQNVLSTEVKLGVTYDIKSLMNDTIWTWYDDHKKIEIFNEIFAESMLDNSFTQMVWANTSHIGCASVTFGEKRAVFFMVCNYGPGGNQVGKKIFSEGPVASHCPSGVEQNAILKGLCGKSSLGIHYDMTVKHGDPYSYTIRNMPVAILVSVLSICLMLEKMYTLFY